MSRRNSVRSGNVVDHEVANLMNLQNKSQYTNALLSLRQRYKDEDLVKKIEDVFASRHSAIVKSAKKFATAVKTKYASQNVPFHQLLMKARAHAKKHRLSEEEFNEFQRIYEQELAGSNSAEVLIPVTNLMKVLGNVTSGSDNYFNVDSNDMRNLQEILKLHDATRQLHAQVLLQALTYIDCEATTTNPQFVGALQSPADHVHPVLVALFLPKLKSVDEHFLYSNISGIVKARYNRQPLRTRADYEVFYNLVTDPNDVVCDTASPVGDLLNRCNLQAQLWNSVLHLRNGQCFNPSLREFMNVIDMCRLNKFDNPDFVYGRHDGTIVKRLFSAFSFRPTVVSTLPIGQIFSYNPYFQNFRPLVTSIPMINLRPIKNAVKPTTTTTTTGTPPAGHIQQSLTQTQQFIEGNMYVERATSVMYSRELIVFFIDRRVNTFTYNNTPFNILRLPSSVGGFEAIVETKIDVDNTITLNDGTVFALKSMVCLNTKPGLDPHNKSAVHVVGSHACVIQQGKHVNPGSDGTPRVVPSKIWTYDPAGIVKSKTVFAPSGSTDTSAEDALVKNAEKNAVILIYQNTKYDETATTTLSFSS